MDTQLVNKKIELIQWLSTLEDTSIIEKLIKLKKEETEDWWNTITGEERASIANGIIDADNQNVEPHAKARELYEKWL